MFRDPLIVPGLALTNSLLLGKRPAYTGAVRQFGARSEGVALYQVLLAEDSPACQLIVRHALDKSEIELTVSPTMAEALAVIDQRGQALSLVILDLNLPDGDGLAILNSLQTDERTLEIPVILLTNKSDLASKVSAFSLGAEDYLIKPIDPIELWIRVKTRLKKIQTRKKHVEHIRRGDLTINMPLMRVSIPDSGGPKDLELTGKEFKILAYLAQNENQIYSRSQLVQAIWGDATHVIERTIDSHICGLRRKLGALAFHVENVQGAGYRFVSKSAV